MYSRVQKLLRVRGGSYTGAYRQKKSPAFHIRLRLCSTYSLLPVDLPGFLTSSRVIWKPQFLDPSSSSLFLPCLTIYGIPRDTCNWPLVSLWTALNKWLNTFTYNSVTLLKRLKLPKAESVYKTIPAINFFEKLLDLKFRTKKEYY